MEAQIKSPLLTKSPFKTILGFSVPLIIGDFVSNFTTQSTV